MYRHLLVVLGNGDLRGGVVTKAAEFAGSIGARITFLAAMTDEEAASPPRHPQDGGAIVYRSAELAREMLAKAEAVARALGVPCASPAGTDASPAQALAQAGASAPDDMLVLSSHGTGSRQRQLLDSAAQAGLPVLVFAAESPARWLDERRAIEAFHAAQREVSMALHLLLRLLERAAQRAHATDGDVADAVAACLRSLAAGPRLAQGRRALFGCLRERTAVVNAEMEELERQYTLDDELLASLDATLALHAAGSLSLHELNNAVSAYADFVWQHTGRMEGVVIPVAQRCLLERDWAQIAADMEQAPPDSRTAGNEAIATLAEPAQAAAPRSR